MEETILKCAEYCIDYKWTVRQIAENMMLSKSTVHKYLTEDLRFIDDEKWLLIDGDVSFILEERR